MVRKNQEGLMEHLSDLVVAIPVVVFTVLAPIVIVSILGKFVRKREDMDPTV